jgi:uncharacterized protein
MPVAPGLAPATRAALEAGRALLDAGRHFEAHEAWEVAWRQEAGEARQLLQGLIQVAAGLHHAGAGNRAGALKLLASGLALLEPLPGEAAGLALEPFRAGARACLAAAQAGAPVEAAGLRLGWATQS